MTKPATTHSRAIDLVGQRFGRLTVIKRHGTKKNGNASWLCQCDCGNKVVVDAMPCATEPSAVVAA